MNRLLPDEKGIGLIEVLVATVVVAIGLLSIASMQGNFLSASGDNKARAEAQGLAERKIEEIKNIMLVSEFNDLASSAAAEEINGVNEAFSRTWVVTDNTTYKEVAVTVSWGDSSNVVLTNQVVFADPAGSASISKFGDEGGGSFGQSPSPNQGASESIEQDTVDLSDSKYTPVEGDDGLYTDSDGNKYRDDGSGKGSLVVSCSTLVQFDADLSYPNNYDPSGVELTTPLSYLYTKRTVEEGVEVILLYTRDFSSTTVTTGGVTTTIYSLKDTCTPQHRYFGGIIIPIKGDIHTEFNLDDIKVDHNKEDMYCAFYAGIGETMQPYACYVGGNCDVTNGDASSVTTCSSTSTVRSEVGSGGFSGNIGLLNVDDEGGGKENVCFQGDLLGTSTDFFTARKYKTTNSSNGKEEGINEPYTCQDFYIVGRQANVGQLSAKCAAEVGSINIPPQEVNREISGDNIVVTTINSSYCGSNTPTEYVLTVTLTNESDSGKSEVITASGTSCIYSGAGSVYTCTEVTAGVSVKVYASDGTKTESCTISDLNSPSCEVTLLEPPTYTFTGSVSVNGSNYSIGISADSYIGDPSCDRSFSCTIQTNESSVRIDASKGNSTDSCNKNGLDRSLGNQAFSNICALEL